MTIYWERCSICGKHHIVKQCTLIPELLVCPQCCIICPRRRVCPKPVWDIEIKPVIKRRATVTRKREAEKVLMDLLSRLEKT